MGKVIIKMMMSLVLVFSIVSCGSSGGGGTVSGFDYSKGDRVVIHKNIRNTPWNTVKKALIEKGLIDVRYKDLEKESCLGFGFKFIKKEVAGDGQVASYYMHDANNDTCEEIDYSSNELARGNGGVIFMFKAK